MSDIAELGGGARGLKLRMATLIGLILLCVCLTITAARGDPADPPMDRQVTPAFRREVVNRVLPWAVNYYGAVLTPYQIRKAYLGNSQYESGVNIFCATFLGDTQEMNVLVSFNYDKVKNLHVKNVLGPPSPRQDTRWCGSYYPKTEGVGRIFSRH